MSGGRNYNPADSGYVEVNKRIEELYKKFPEASIQSEITVLQPDLVVVKAFVFRTPDDPRPAIGHSQMMIPGTTPYTRDSEIENAETSAWGRAIAALGFEVKKSVASANEVRNKSKASETAAPVEDTTPEADRPAPKPRRDEVVKAGTDAGLSKDELKALRESVTDKATSSQFTEADVVAMLAAIDAAAKAKAATGGEIVK